MLRRGYSVLTVPGVFVGNYFIAAAEELLKGLLEVLIEGDVDDGVDHGMRVGEHVDPEGVSEKKKKYCDNN